MKRFLFIIATAGLMAGINANATPPFYKVQCYDANDKLVNCDEIGKVKKHAAKKSTKAKIAKVKKADAIAQQKAREKAIALRALAKQNEELKAEMEALRKANLLAAAKTEEKPAETAQLAATTTAQIPANVPAPVAISTTQVAKEPEATTASPWSFNLLNWVRKSAQKNSPLANELDPSITYNFSPDYSLTVENDLDWNWTNPKNDPKQGFAPEDFQTAFGFNNIYATASKQTTVFGDIAATAGTSEHSRDIGMLLNVRFRVRLQTKINDQKGWFRFDTYITPAVYKYATSSKVTDTVNIDGYGSIDKLSPNSRLDTGVRVWFHHTIVGGLAFETTVRLRGKYTFADEVDLGGGAIETLTDAQWQSDIELELPRISYTVNDAFSFDGAMVSTGSLAKFRPFNIDNGNDLQFVFRMFYNI